MPLDALAPDQRAVVQLVLQRGRSYAQIAELLKISEDAVRARAHAGLAALAPDVELPADKVAPDRRLPARPAERQAAPGDPAAAARHATPPTRWAATVRAQLEDVGGRCRTCRRAASARPRTTPLAPAAAAAATPAAAAAASPRRARRRPRRAAPARPRRVARPPTPEGAVAASSSRLGGALLIGGGVLAVVVRRAVPVRVRRRRRRATTPRPPPRPPPRRPPAPRRRPSAQINLSGANGVQGARA